MNNYRTFLILWLLSFTTVFSADRISDIQYPLTARPTIVKAGDSFKINCKGSSSSSNWSVRISTPFNSVNLSTDASWNADNRRWTLMATVPENTPFELYDLSVSASDVNDQAVHAVKVISEYKDSYCFIHLPDLHLPSVSWIGYYDDSNTIPEFLKILNEISIINPEFVLQTGDFVDNGQIEDQYNLAQELLFTSQVPMFLTGGNHDLWYDGHRYWKRYISPIMNYKFTYGDHLYAGLEMYDIPTVTFTADQMEWLQNTLDESITNEDKLRTLFYHYDESRQIDNDFVDDFLVDLTLYGHTHINGEKTLGTRGALNLNTSFTMNNVGQYRLIKVSGDEIESWPLLTFKNLNVDFAPANDGTNWKVAATVTNENNAEFNDAMIKFYVQHNSAGYQVAGGQVAQVISSSQTDVYYVNVSIAPNSQQEVTITSNSAPSNNPPIITAVSPTADTSVIAGIEAEFRLQANDPDNGPMTYSWFVDGEQVSGSSAIFSYIANKNFTGLVEIKGKVSDGTFYDDYTWMVEVDEYTSKPKIVSSTLNFFLHNEEMEMKWVEPQSINARFEYGLQPGVYTGYIEENGNNSVIFTPELEGMGLGVNYCRITDGEISSDPFTVIIESPIAPQMQTPIGNIEDLAPVFTWDRVPGVPYYIVICSDEEIIIEEDMDTREFTVEGANPIWSVLTSDNSVPYGMPDPSGTYTSVPAPLMPGSSYWWVVLNCYGNAPELTSPVQSGISKFTVDLPLPNIAKPTLTSPANNVVLDDEIITFKWQPVDGASSYHFYPFKIEQEFGIETARAVWQSTITTTETEYDYPAGEQFMKGNYRWKVAAVAENGMEVLSDGRDFTYDAPAAKLSIYTYDNMNTPLNTGDDKMLPRVTIVYEALDGIHNDMPLSTDLHGSRLDYNISPGVYEFKISKEGYDTQYDTLTFAADQEYTTRFRLNPSQSAVSGRVVDDNNGAVNDATITAQHGLHQEIIKVATTDAQGNFRLSVSPGPYLIWATKDAYQLSDTLNVSVVSGEQASLQENLVVAKNANKITGKVVNTSQQPIYGVKVVLTNGETFEKTTDANGQFSFSVPDAVWSLHAEKQGFISPEPRSITTSGGQTIEISPSIVLEANAGIIQGRATDGSRQLTNVTIKAFPASGQPYETQSDDYGQFSLNVVQGTYTLSAIKDGYISPDDIQATVSSGQTKSGIEFVLSQASSTVKGKVTIDGYTPLAGVQVSNSGKSTMTTDGGYFELGITPGTHVIKAFKEGYISSTPDTVSLSAGQVLENVNFVLSPNASVIKGKLYSSNGPVYNAIVKAVNSHTVETKSDQEGNFVLNLQAGTWDIKVSKSGFVSQEKTSQVLGVGQTLTGLDFELVPNIATIKGSVISSLTGAPIKNAEISIPDAELTTLTTIDGSFTLSVGPGSYSVFAGKAGFRTIEKTTGSIAANVVKNLEFQLESLSSSFKGNISDTQNSPIEGVLVFAVNSVDTFKTFSKTDGSYRLDVKPAMYNISAQKEGFKPASISTQTSISEQEAKILNTVTLLSDKGNIAGMVKRVSNDAPVSSARITAKSADGFSIQTQSDNSGHFSFLDENGFPTLISGKYNVRVSKSGFTADTLFNITIASEQTVQVEAHILKNEGVITGIVKTDKVPVENVTITAQKTGTEEFYNTLSQQDGSFSINNLAIGTYRLTAAKVGYSSPDAQNVDTGIYQEIVLMENNGNVSGKIVDSESNNTVSGVEISATDGHGNYATEVSDNSGRYQLQQLAQTYEYSITYKKSGYKQETRQAIKVSESTGLDIEIEKIYGNVTGTIKDAAGAAMPGVMVTAQSATQSFSDTTDASGNYTLNHLPATQYTIAAFRVGYASDPVQQIVSLWQGGTVASVNYEMVEAIVAELKIIGPDYLNNTIKETYSFSAKTSDQRQASISPQWSVDFVTGIDELSANGLLDPANDYVGTLNLTLTDSYTNMSSTKSIAVTQALVPDNSDLQVSNKKGVQLFIEDSCVTQNAVLQLRKPALASSMKNTKNYQIVGDVYQLSPAGFTFSKPATLVMPVPEDKSAESLTVGRWNTKWLEWEIVEDVNTSGGQLSVSLSALGRFAIMESAKPLGIHNIRFNPNPFSPNVAPLEILFDLTSDKTVAPKVTVKIYNMVGDLVKTVVDGEFIEKGTDKVLYWDGITDYGKMAMNGRYLIHFQIKDSSGDKEELKTFVLIK